MATSKSLLKPLKDLRISKYQIPAFNGIPNTSIQGKPLLIYHSAFNADVSEIESHLKSVGVVTPQWRYTMYSTTHFHSNTHEVLSVFSGRANLCFGGEANPERVETTAEKGDVMVVPAGVGHRLLEDLDGGFQMVGAYPKGKSWDMCYGGEEDKTKFKNIEGLEWFEKDPVYGHEGPVLDL